MSLSDPGVAYPNPNRKRVATTTADFLERFARLLSEWNRTGRRMVREEVPF